MPVVPKTLTLAQYNTVAEESEEENVNPPADLNTFLNSLFDPWPGPFAVNPAATLFRTGLVTDIKAAEIENTAVSPICWLVDDATVTLLVDILQGYWNNQAVLDNPVPRTIRRDESFIHCVKNYIDANNLQMRVPAFQCKTKEDDKPSTYKWVSDQVFSFKNDDGGWNSVSVRRFLELLLAGAHFVVVHSKDDLGNNVNLPPSFFRTFSDLGTKYAGHSHYTNKVAMTGVNYPELALVTDEGETLDELQDNKAAVLLPVVLSDTTTSPLYNYNSFFQMEGWRPGTPMYMPFKAPYNNTALAGGYRHGADFNTHQKTLWNISTYGASLFSEKRGAPIFLAPKSWMDKQKHVYAGFAGANGGHAWFKAGLVTDLP